MEYSCSEIAELKNKYALSAEEFEEMYKKCEFITFYKCTKSDNPTAIFVGGQTGSGKGGIDVYSEKEFIKKGIIAAVIDVDVYRVLHPRTEEILKKYPTIYTNLTAETTGKIVKRIIKHAIDNRYSFIFEGTMKNTEAFETMKSMPNYFNKIVRVMAVPKVESLLTAFERNDEQINITGFGRFTNVETHNATYEGVLNTIEIIENEDNSIVIEVFARGKDMASPIKIFTSKEDKKSAVHIIKKARSEKVNNADIVNKRLTILLNNLRPKDKYEEEQMKRLINEIKIEYNITI